MNLHPAAAICIPILVGALTSYLATKRGRSWSVWFFVGGCIGLLGTLILFLLPKKVKESESNHSTFLAPSVENQKLWYYLDRENQQCGPVSTSKLQEDLHSGDIHDSTFVWNEEMENWKKISEVDETRSLLPLS